MTHHRTRARRAPALALALALALPFAATQAAEIRMTAAAAAPAMVPPVAVMARHVLPEASRRIQAATGDTLKWTEAYGGALFNVNGAVGGIADGIADIGWVGSTWAADKQPLHSVINAAPFMSGSGRIQSEVHAELLRTVPEFAAEWTKNKLKFLGPMAGDEYVLVSKKPVRTHADLKGMKIYAPGAIGLWLSGTGASALDGGIPSFYSGMQTGVADAALVPLAGVMLFKFTEVAKYVTRTQIGTGGMNGGLAMNVPRFESLPPAAQKVFVELGAEYQQHNIAGVEAMTSKALEFIKATGGEIIEMPAAEQRKWADGTGPLAAEWVKRMEARGLPGRKVLEAYVKAHEARGAAPVRDWLK